jgi:hypothetical protein
MPFLPLVARPRGDRLEALSRARRQNQLSAARDNERQALACGRTHAFTDSLRK